MSISPVQRQQALRRAEAAHALLVTNDPIAADLATMHLATVQSAKDFLEVFDAAMALECMVLKRGIRPADDQPLELQ